ncbi:MAG: 30S ribosomal protein S17 [Thermofilum sp. ex4484_79]|nr:MAG: 30S ribosomal protein S17 [Thermofilum sp. ex4484_79]
MESVKVRNVGIPGVKPPENICDDPLCPWHGKLPVRGVILTARVEKVKAHKMAVVTHEYLHFVKKYMRYEKRRKKKHAYLPPCIQVKPGDLVIIGETRPLAKSVSFVVLDKIRR